MNKKLNSIPINDFKYFRQPTSEEKILIHNDLESQIKSHEKVTKLMFVMLIISTIASVFMLFVFIKYGEIALSDSVLTLLVKVACMIFIPLAFLLSWLLYKSELNVLDLNNYEVIKATIIKIDKHIDTLDSMHLETEFGEIYESFEITNNLINCKEGTCLYMVKFSKKLNSVYKFVAIQEDK